MPSYFTERTAEYTIVPPLVEYLSDRFGCAVPMFFWTNREGNAFSRQLHKGEVVRLLAVFARRPKILVEGNVVHGKLNRELMEFSRRAAAIGIPSIAGFPAVRNFLDLGRTFATHWFRMSHFLDDEVNFSVSLSSSKAKPADEAGTPIPTIDFCDVGDILKNESQPLPWADATRAIAEARAGQTLSGFFERFGGNAYKVGPAKPPQPA